MKPAEPALSLQKNKTTKETCSSSATLEITSITRSLLASGFPHVPPHPRACSMENKPGNSYVVTQLKGLKPYKSWVKRAKGKAGTWCAWSGSISPWKAPAGPGCRRVTPAAGTTFTTRSTVPPVPCCLNKMQINRHLNQKFITASSLPGN